MSTYPIYVGTYVHYYLNKVLVRTNVGRNARQVSISDLQYCIHALYYLDQTRDRMYFQ